jgi:hypothetical protein
VLGALLDSGKMEERSVRLANGGQVKTEALQEDNFGVRGIGFPSAHVMRGALSVKFDGLDQTISTQNGAEGAEGDKLGIRPWERCSGCGYHLIGWIWVFGTEGISPGAKLAARGLL